MERTAGEPKLAGEGKLRGGRATTPPDCEGPPPPQPAYIEVLACAAQVVLCGDVVQSTVTVEELTDCSAVVCSEAQRHSVLQHGMIECSTVVHWRKSFCMCCRDGHVGK